MNFLAKWKNNFKTKPDILKSFNQIEVIILYLHEEKPSNSINKKQKISLPIYKHTWCEISFSWSVPIEMLVHVGEGQVPVLIEGDDEARGEAPNLVDTAGPNLNFDLLLFPFPVKRFYYLSMLICLVSPRFSLTKSYFAKKNFRYLSLNCFLVSFW